MEFKLVPGRLNDEGNGFQDPSVKYILHLAAWTLW